MTSRTDRPPLVIVGHGHVSQHYYLPALRRAGWPVAAVVDPAPYAYPDAEPLDASTVRYGTLDELASGRWRGAVALNLTPIGLHASVTERLLRMGLHVYTEKPAAPAATGWQRLVTVARDSGRVLVSAPHVHRGWTAATLATIVRDRVLGNPLALHVDGSKVGAAVDGRLEPHRRWFYEAGAGAVRDLGPYPVSLLVALLGAPTRTRWAAGGGNVAAPPDSPDPHEQAARLFDTHALLAEWAAGPVATVHVATGRIRLGGPSFVMYCEEGRVEADFWRVDSPVHLYRTPTYDEVVHEELTPPHPPRGMYDISVAYLAELLDGSASGLERHWAEVSDVLTILDGAVRPDPDGAGAVRPDPDGADAVRPDPAPAAAR